MIFFALAFVLGAFCLQQMPLLPSLYWAFLLVPCVLVYCALDHSALVYFQLHHSSQHAFIFLRRFLLVAFSFLLGFFYAASYAMFRLSDALPHAWENKPVVMIGVVASASEFTERGERFRFDVEQVLTKPAVIPQHISLSYYPPGSWNDTQTLSAARVPKFRAGERWRITARLKRPHGTQNPHGFDFEAWALAENIRATGTIKAKADNAKLQDFVWRPQYLVEHVRELIQQRISRALADKPYSGIIQALVMGDDSQIAVNDWQLFLRTGTSHLMSISGLHITMLSGLAFGVIGFIWRRIPLLAMRLPTRKAATVGAVLVALVYALIAGFAVPAQRTLYMIIVFAVALWTGRQLIISQVLALALLLVVMLDPWAVIAPGFWLSFGAVAILAYALGARVGMTHWLKASLQTQWAVTIGMLPLLLIMFHQASIISPLANAFAIPLISFIVTPLALLGSFLCFDFALNLSYQALNVCMQLLIWLNQLPAAVWQQQAPPVWTLLPALLGVAWVLLPRGVPMRWVGWLGILPMLLIVPQHPQSGDMKVTVLDVGQGLSVVVQTAAHTLLYDAGAKYSAQADVGGRIVLPYLQGAGVHHLDGFVVSHNDTDHSGGMTTVLEQMPVDWLASSLPEHVELAGNFDRMKCFAGQSWTWDGVDFEMLNPVFESYDDSNIADNNRSCVLQVTSASGNLLLTGDIQKEVELVLVEKYARQLKSNVLVVPHHGSKTSSSAGFIAAVQPELTIFTAGYLNRFQHPRTEVLTRYEQAGSQILRSDYDGAVTLNFAADDKTGVITAGSWRKQNKHYWHDLY